MHTSAVGSYNLDFLAILPEAQRGSAAQNAYFLKAKIMDLKIGLNCKIILVSHSPEVR